MIEFIKSQGYRVFTCDGKQDSTYCYFTDGVNIGYAQWSRMATRVATVNIPCQQCGTGFVVADEVTKESLKEAFSIAPNWATSRDRGAVRKYKNIDAFLQANKFNSKYIEV